MCINILSKYMDDVGTQLFHCLNLDKIFNYFILSKGKEIGVSDAFYKYTDANKTSSFS